MTAGIHILNDKQSVQISHETIPMVYHEKISHNLKNISGIPLKSDNGTISVFRPLATFDRVAEYGIYHPFGITAILPDRIKSDLWIEQYIFKPQIKQSSRVGMQIFDENGGEIFNSDSLLLSIIDKVTLDPSQSWADLNFHFWTNYYANTTKFGFLFTNLPSGLSKSNSMPNIWAYDYRFVADNHLATFAFKPSTMTYSFSSAEIPLDYSLRTEFFIVDLSNLP